MRIIYGVRHRYEIRLKIEGKFLTFVTKLVPEGKTSFSYTIKQNLPLYCREFSAFLVVII